MEDEWLSVAEAAKQLGKPERTVRRWASKLGNDDRRVRPNKSYVVRLAALKQFMDGQQDSHSQPPDTGGQERQADIVEMLKSEVEFLREQLRSRDVAEGEMRRLMLSDKQELQQLREQKALPPAPDSKEDTPVPWWKLWRKA